MAKRKIVIEIESEKYEAFMNDWTFSMDILHAVRNGTPLPKNHGRLIDADYVINHICESKECYKEKCKGKLYMRCMDIKWVDDAPTIIEGGDSE